MMKVKENRIHILVNLLVKINQVKVMKLIVIKPVLIY